MKERRRKERQIIEDDGGESDIVPIVIASSFLEVAWLVIHDIASAAIQKSRRWLPSPVDREEMPPTACGEVFEQIARPFPQASNETGPQTANIASAASVTAIVAATLSHRRAPRKSVREIVQIIGQEAELVSVAQDNPEKTFAEALRANKHLKTKVEQLVDELVKAAQDKDRGWMRDEEGNRVRRPPRQSLTVVDFANLWKSSDPADEAIRANQVIAIAKAIDGLKGSDRALVTLLLKGCTAKEIARVLGCSDSTVYNIQRRAFKALSRRLKGLA
jgi:RNA polymerase sigma factor (sigma-70 family)